MAIFYIIGCVVSYPVTRWMMIETKKDPVFDSNRTWLDIFFTFLFSLGSWITVFLSLMFIGYEKFGKKIEKIRHKIPNPPKWM